MAAFLPVGIAVCINTSMGVIPTIGDVKDTAVNFPIPLARYAYILGYFVWHELFSSMGGLLGLVHDDSHGVNHCPTNLETAFRVPFNMSTGVIEQLSELQGLFVLTESDTR